MTAPSNDRTAGSVLLLLAALVSLEARTYIVGFLTDPVGPRAVPFLVAGLLAVAGVWLIVGPGVDKPWPVGGVWKRIGFAVFVLVIYAILIDTLGFFVTTTLAVTGLSLTFGGPLRSSALAGAAFAVCVYVLFVYLLGIPLPIGDLFLVDG